MHAICGLVCLLFSALVLADEPLVNRLAGHPSPYLAMHGADPVHWQTWDQTAFKRAQRENKLIFVSSGYFSCHWCHVMQRESYRDAAIAAYINDHFIPIKIDRELLPDVDAGLVDFAEHTRGQAGWPLNVFLTPAGHPLIAVLYLPPQSFQAFLENLTEQWTAAPTRLTDMARAAAEHVAAEPQALPAAIDASITAELAERFVEHALDMADELAGGFGAQNKFPMVPQLWALLDVHAVSGDERLRDFLVLTLEQMASQGLRDHLAGGFFRYAVDPGWQTPHFEKMLYDNALLARLYLRAASLFGRADFAEVARATLDFVLDEMAASGGGYYAAFSAVDADGIEGGYYLWEADELERIAAADWPLLRRYFGLDVAQSLDAGHHLIPRLSIVALAAEQGITQQQARQRLHAVQAKLLAQRQLRKLPVDTKVLTAWNSLLLTALVDAAQYFKADDSAARYRQSADRLRAFLLERPTTAGRVLRTPAAQSAMPAGLEDYVYLLEALQVWQSAYGRDADKTLSALLELSWKAFYRNGRWRQGEDELLRWRETGTAVTDGPMPAAPAVLIKVSIQRQYKIGAALDATLPIIVAQPFWYASYIGLY